MKRRLFLQCLGLGTAATALPPVVATADAPTIAGLKHYVISSGSYTGALFDGDFWLKGTNAGIVMAGSPSRDGAHYSLDELDKAKGLDLEGTKKGLQKYQDSHWEPRDDVQLRLAQALALYRAEIHEDLKTLVSGKDKEAHRFRGELSLVTVIRNPLQAEFKPAHKPTWKGAPDKVTPARACVRLSGCHFILRGTLKPIKIWSEDGRIPLEDDFETSEDLHNFRDEQARSRITLVDHQDIPEDAPSLDDLGEPRLRTDKNRPRYERDRDTIKL